MIPSLKTFGLAFAAVMALSSLVASAATAQQGVLTSDGPVTLDVETLGEKSSGSNALTAFGARTECFGSSSTGHRFDVTPHEPIESGASTITNTDHVNQTECRSTTGETERPATVEGNGCDYAVHVGETTPGGNEEGTFGLVVDLVCPEGEKVHIPVWPAETSPEEHATSTPLCTLEAGSQTGLEGIHATDEGNGHLRVKGTIKNIELTRHGVCQFFQPTTTTGAELHVDATVAGTDSVGEATAVSLSH